MKNVEIYTTAYCPYCTQAKRLLDSKGVPYTEIDVAADPVKKAEMIERANRRTVPQIFIDNQSIGGCDDLYTLNDGDKLDKLLQD